MDCCKCNIIVRPVTVRIGRVDWMRGRGPLDNQSAWTVVSAIVRTVTVRIGRVDWMRGRGPLDNQSAWTVVSAI